MTVESVKADVFLSESVPDRHVRLPGLYRDAELTVHPSGRYCRMGVRVDSRSKPQNYWLDDSFFTGVFVNTVKLGQIVNHKVTDSAVNTVNNILVGFIVAVEK